MINIMGGFYVGSLSVFLYSFLLMFSKIIRKEPNLIAATSTLQFLNYFENIKSSDI